MDDPTKVVILYSIVSLFGAILTFLAVFFFNRLVKQGDRSSLSFSKILDKLDLLTNKTNLQDLKIENLEKNEVRTWSMQESHQNRIQDLEKNVLVINSKLK